MFKKIWILFLIPFVFYTCATPQVKVRTITKTIVDTVYMKEVKEIRIPEKFKTADLKNYKINDAYFPSVGHDERIKFLVMHYTALDHYASINVLTQQQVSSHYLVPDTDNDEIYLLVSEDKRAWHAGYSHWGKRNNINDTSIGIEIVNLGFKQQGNEMIWYPYPDFQVKKVAELAQSIIDRYQIEPQNVIGHSDVAPQRKYDPGPLFPWEKLYKEYGIGAWYDEEGKKFFMQKFPSYKMNQVKFILSVQADLQKYGYEIEKSGAWDSQTQKVIRAFQWHFRPANYDGKLDAETWAILQSLLEKYRK